MKIVNSSKYSTSLCFLVVHYVSLNAASNAHLKVSQYDTRRKLLTTSNYIQNGYGCSNKGIPIILVQPDPNKLAQECEAICDSLIQCTAFQWQFNDPAYPYEGINCQYFQQCDFKTKFTGIVYNNVPNQYKIASTSNSCNHVKKSNTQDTDLLVENDKVVNLATCTSNCEANSLCKYVAYNITSQKCFQYRACDFKGYTNEGVLYSRPLPKLTPTPAHTATTQQTNNVTAIKVTDGHTKNTESSDDGNDVDMAIAIVLIVCIAFFIAGICYFTIGSKKIPTVYRTVLGLLKKHDETPEHTLQSPKKGTESVPTIQ